MGEMRTTESLIAISTTHQGSQSDATAVDI
jgi:hypothetical protein